MDTHLALTTVSDRRGQSPLVFGSGLAFSSLTYKDGLSFHWLLWVDSQSPLISLRPKGHARIAAWIADVLRRLQASSVKYDTHPCGP
jgi:hypothetical protein